MGDDKRSNEPDQTPASVVFTEMMRREAERRAATSQPAPPAEAVEDPPPSAAPTDEAPPEAALQAQRIRRVERRKERRRTKTVSTIAGFLRTLFVVIISGGLIATILSWWTSPQSLDSGLRAELQQLSITPTPLPTLVPTPNYLRRIGIVSGHRGPENDPGAVCDDGLMERDINYAVAQRVVLRLREMGYTVDLLDEFDPRLEGYEAEALVSIHSNDCRDYGEFVSGYLISQAEARPENGPDRRLQECIATHYGQASQLDRRFGLTRDMQDYHIFRSIKATTPGVILELGFMKDDRELLTTQPDLLAGGVVNGILCFIEADAVPETTPAVTTEQGST